MAGLVMTVGSTAFWKVTLSVKKYLVEGWSVINEKPSSSIEVLNCSKMSRSCPYSIRCTVALFRNADRTGANPPPLCRFGGVGRGVGAGRFRLDSHDF